MDPRYDRYRPDVTRDHRTGLTLDSRDRRAYGFEPGPPPRHPSTPMGGPIDFDRRTTQGHDEHMADHARRVADRLMGSDLLNGRSARGRPDREAPLPLPSPPPRAAPYDIDSRPNRHDYRPVLQVLPKMKKLSCKGCHGSKGSFF